MPTVSRRDFLWTSAGHRPGASPAVSTSGPDSWDAVRSRLSALLENEIGQLIANLGPERLLFGTGMPFNYPDPALLKLDVLDASAPDKEGIRWQNAAKWLRL